jgi:hypothetical protein
MVSLLLISWINGAVHQLFSAPMKKTLLSLLLTSSSSLAFAQTDSTDTGKLSISGYLDSYYLTAFNRPKSGNLLGVDQLAGRAFDRLTDQFALGLVQVKLGYASRKTDMVVDLTFGPNAELGNFGNTAGALNGYRPQSPYGAALYGTSAAIKQVYFTYRATPKLSFTVGQFGTHIGYEVIDAPLNYHYSLSNLFNNGPFYHVVPELHRRLGRRYLPELAGEQRRAAQRLRQLHPPAHRPDDQLPAHAQVLPGPECRLWPLQLQHRVGRRNGVLLGEVR